MRRPRELTQPVWFVWYAPWNGGRAIYHLWGGASTTVCRRPLGDGERLSDNLPRWIADTFARVCKRCEP